MTGKNLFVASAVAAVSLSFAAGLAVAKATAAKAPELTAMADLTWTPMMKGSAMPATAPIEGDAAKGAYAGFLKLPAGSESPPHIHTNEYWAVLVQGEMTHWAADGGSEKNSKKIGVGGVTHMPSKVAHISKCYPGADCIMVVIQKGKSDFIVPKEAAAKANAPKADVPAKKM